MTSNRIECKRDHPDIFFFLIRKTRFFLQFRSYNKEIGVPFLTDGVWEEQRRSNRNQVNNSIHYRQLHPSASISSCARAATSFHHRKTKKEINNKKTNKLPVDSNVTNV